MCTLGAQADKGTNNNKRRHIPATDKRSSRDDLSSFCLGCLGLPQRMMIEVVKAGS